MSLNEEKVQSVNLDKREKTVTTPSLGQSDQKFFSSVFYIIFLVILPNCRALHMKLSNLLNINKVNQINGHFISILTANRIETKEEMFE